MSAKKELKEVLKSGHKMYLAPDGVNKVTVPSTPGGGRGMDNMLAELRRYGFWWKGR
jgi:hypothetical protein